MGLSIDVSIPAVTVFLQGILSFFSPCVLPLLPLYIGYLSGGTAVRGEDGQMHYRRSAVMLHTLFFVLGVSFTFFLLGLGVSAVGTFFRSSQAMFARLGGVLVALFGLYQLGIFGSSELLGKERRLPFHLDRLSMSPVTAFLMGFTFSFAWTPCVGPALTSVLLMAASAATRGLGFLLIGVYTLGFVLPFLAVGLFTTSLLALFKRHRNVVQYTVKLGGVLMIVMGVMIFTGKMNDVTGYLSGVSAGQMPGAGQEAGAGQAESSVRSDEADPGQPDAEKTENAGKAAEAEQTDDRNSGNRTERSGQPDAQNTEAAEEPDRKEESALPPAIDFELQDQFGNTHTLADYRGKTIFLNFWATWCPPCKAEMPDIQKLYETYDTEGEDALIVLGVAGPNMGRETDEEGIKTFLEENSYTYPVLMDRTGELFDAYGIYSFPTTFMIDRDGNIFGYVSGMLSEEMMKSIIDQTMSGERVQ